MYLWWIFRRKWNKIKNSPNLLNSNSNLPINQSQTKKLNNDCQISLNPSNINESVNINLASKNNGKLNISKDGRIKVE